MATLTAALVSPRTKRLTINRVGLWLFILSESFLFGALLSSCFYLRGVAIPSDVNQLLGLGLTAILLLCSLTAYLSEACSAHGDQKGFQRNLLAPIVLGALFIGGVCVEWNEASSHFPPFSGYGTIFFTTGIHAFYVLSGLIALVVYGLGRSGRFTKGSYWPLEGPVKYSHFVDVAWVFIYPTLYRVN